MMDRDARGEIGAHRIFLGLVADHGDAPHALAIKLEGDLRHGKVAVHGLAAGHGDRVVV